MTAKRQNLEENEVIKARKRCIPAQKTCRQCGKPFTALGAGQFCCEACRAEYQMAYMRAYDAARREKRASQQKERRASLTQEERDEINRRARENYRKRKERASNGQN